MVRNHWIALMTGTLGIGCVDLDFGGDTAEPNLPNLIIPWFNYENLGDTYEFSVQVENQGYANADSFSVDLYLDQDTEPGESHMGDLREMLCLAWLQGMFPVLPFPSPRNPFVWTVRPGPMSIQDFRSRSWKSGTTHGVPW